jgi:hypothetical protein
MSDDDFDEWLIEALDEIERQQTAKKLRQERPWLSDIIRVLWGHRSAQGMRIEVLSRELWHMRQPSGLNMPREFQKTVQSFLNQHTSQSSVWARNGAKPADDLFFSPQGKRSGTWAVHRDRAINWIKAKNLSPI